VGSDPARKRAHAFIEHDGRLRWWELPGGDVEPGEDPAAAVVRETFEETGLRIEAPTLLRAWWYENRLGTAIEAYAFAAHADSTTVSLNPEHTEFAWMTAGHYAKTYCPELPAEAPSWQRLFLSEMRENCRLFDGWLARS
jgi:8-oxo-dGTP pyrophosphatase MutT (NUDIX family)